MRDTRESHWTRSARSVALDQIFQAAKKRGEVVAIRVFAPNHVMARHQLQQTLGDQAILDTV
jgi:hypothetical protein